MNSQKKTRKILVTAALPYANGRPHLGHIVEYVQADIFVRFQKMRGHHCYYICGSDAHGTPIMLAAEKQRISPEQLINEIGPLQLQDIQGFNVQFDHFYTTHSPENQELSAMIFNKLFERGDIEIKTIEQAFDPEKHMFLPDRYVKGECPRCHAKDQYGDNCEACGATYAPMDMKNPVSAISGAVPIKKTSDHLFFNLENYRERLKVWMKEGALQPEVINKLNEWLKDELHAWDISRDAPYFGFEIPGYPNKYFYVWMDAPVGYMASFKKLCELQPEIDFNEFWQADSKAELYHFVGKDVTYFHALFWPAMLMGADYRTPSAVFSHGFLTINGQKMSKSRGTFIKAQTWLAHLNPEAFRYYVAAKLNSRTEDIDLNLEDFVQRVNADLVGKVVNIASRCAGFIHKKFSGLLVSQLQEEELFLNFSSKAELIANLYEEREFSRVVREIMEMADTINHYIDEHKPWVLAKEESHNLQLQQICSLAINLFRLLILFLKPILPNMASAAEEFLNIPPLQWSDATSPLVSHKINVFKPLMVRVEKAQVDALLTAELQ